MKAKVQAASKTEYKRLKALGANVEAPAALLPPWEALERAIASTVKAPGPPPGSFTRDEFCERMSFGEDKAREMLLKLIALGYVRKLPYRGSTTKVYYEYTGVGGL